MPVHERLLRTNPAYARARTASENIHFAVQTGQRPLTRAAITTIPVVVHVVHHTAAQNIPQEQIESQIDVLNLDYRMANPDVRSVPPPYSAVVADARIQFALATTDPSGAATDGITRTSTRKASFSDDDRVKSAATGGADPWPADRYLNIWVVPRLTSAIGDLLGYAQFPGAPAATDGVVILHSAFGTNGTASAPYNLGRTTTHEVGHWLNLRHIWGDDGNGCNGDDFVADTPNQGGPNYGTPAFPHVSCANGPTGDMFMNYMDYVNDAAMFMFTVGQAVRMQTCLEFDRNSIGSAAAAPASETPGPSKLQPGDGVPNLPFSASPAPPAMAWTQPAPAAIQQLMATAQQELSRYEAALNVLASAGAAGQLGEEDRQRAEALYQEYVAFTGYLRQYLGLLGR